MSGSINIPVENVAKYDFVHWTDPRCPGDQYSQVVDVAPNGDLVVILLGIRRFVPARFVTAAVRNEPDRAKRGPFLPACRGPWGKPIVTP